MNYISKAAYLLSFGVMAAGSVVVSLGLIWVFLTITSELYKQVLHKMRVWKVFILVSNHYWSSRDRAVEWAAKDSWEEARKLLPKLKTYTFKIKEDPHD